MNIFALRLSPNNANYWILRKYLKKNVIYVPILKFVIVCAPYAAQRTPQPHEWRQTMRHWAYNH